MAATNILTAIASRITPKNFFIAPRVALLIFLSRKPTDLRTIYITRRLTAIPTIILGIVYTDLNDMIVVRVPDPANIGKPSGTMLPELPRSGS